MLTVPMCPLIYIFQFTTSQGGRPEPSFLIIFPISFNSRPHKEVDPGNDAGHVYDKSFNSRPHKEVDSNVEFKDKSGNTFQFTTSQGGRLNMGMH